MIIKNIKQVLSLKFIILTICIFAAISISSKNLLVDLINSNYLNVSKNSLSAYEVVNDYEEDNDNLPDLYPLRKHGTGTENQNKNRH